MFRSGVMAVDAKTKFGDLISLRIEAHVTYERSHMLEVRGHNAEGGNKRDVPHGCSAVPYYGRQRAVVGWHAKNDPLDVFLSNRNVHSS